MKPAQTQPDRTSLTLAVLGHHRCASTYFHHILRTASRLLGLRMKAIYFGEALPLGYHLQERFSKNNIKNTATILSGQYDILYHGNASNSVVKALESRGRYRAIHLIRDPRDIIVSGYFSHLYSHSLDTPWFKEQRHRLQNLDNLEKGLLAEIDFNACVIESIGTWDYANPNIYELRFEKLVENPLGEFTIAFEFLGLMVGEVSSNKNGFALQRLQWGSAFLASTRFGFVMDLVNQHLAFKTVPNQKYLPQPVLPMILWLNGFEKKSHGRKRGEVDLKSHYRKGIAGDWRNYFTPTVDKAFKERYGSLLIKLNYEKDLDW